MEYPKIRGKRCELKISQREMAEKLGIAGPTYTKKENGQTDFTLEEAKKLCQLFNCKFEDIFLNELSTK